MPCAFCGEEFQKPHRLRSKEHVWAKRWAKYAPTPEGKFTHTVRRPDGTVIAEWSSDELAVIAKSVCEPCNNGWMADLENLVDPYFATLMRGKGRTLSEAGQTTLSAWAVKTALAVQLATPEASEYPTEHYRAMHRLKTKPPPQTIVWLASYQGGADFHSDPHHLTLHRGDGSTRDGYQTTLVVGQAVFQVFGHLHEEEVTWPRRSRTNVAAQIWPVRHAVTFPPLVLLTDSSLSDFCEPPTGRARRSR